MKNYGLNTDIIYISCNTSLGNFSSWNEGLFRSIDGGNTWEQLTLPVNYPASDYKTDMRKVVLDPNGPDNIFLITYRDVYRSTDQGNNWTTVFHRDYSKWGDDSQWGLFDFKIIPWNQNIGYLAGSEIFKIEDPSISFTEYNISDEIFFAGLNSADYERCIPDRTEISIHRNYPDKVYFCYYAKYIPINGDSFYRLRVISYDNISQNYAVAYESDDDVNFVFADANKLEFAVSPSNDHIFYVGGILIGLIDIDNDREEIIAPSSDHKSDCWAHVDMRDMQIFSHNGRDTIYLANDAGISWGTPFESGLSSGNCDWQWHHPFSSTENGLNVTEFYGIGLFDKEQDLVAGGCQDLNDMILNNDSWINFGTGDGSELIWDPEDRNIFYYSEWQSGALFRTNDMGTTLQLIDCLGISSLIIPMKLDPKDRSILYSGKKYLLKYSGVNINFNDPVDDPESLHSFAPDSLSDIEVVPAAYDKRKFYISTLKQYTYENPAPPSPEDYSRFIFRSKYTGDVLSFEDISQNLEGCSTGFISDIEVNPNRISQIWVAFAVYSMGTGQASKVFTSDNSGDTWEKYSLGLPPGLPVYKIKYVQQQPPHYLLFALTDVGIFKSTDEDPTWYPFNQNLPEKIVTDLEINPKFNTVVAATFGRGLWKSPILCHFNSDALEIAESETWENDIILDRSIIIPSGRKLTIKNCRVHLPSEAKIIVQRGATLELDDCTLTSACNDLWWGVELWGDSHNEQTSSYQGTVILKNGAVIEKARKAIFCGKNIEQPAPDRAYTGGIIEAIDATFRNNRYGIQIWSYRYPDRNYNSRFKMCKFQTTEMLADGSSPEYFMTLVQVKGITIEACVFEYLVENGIDFQNHGCGIFSLDAGYEILNLEGGGFSIQSKFKNLEYGIFAMKVFEDPIILIHDSRFIRNLTGVYARGLQNLNLYLNDFLVYRLALPNNHIFGGVYLDNCTAYTIEENDFNGYLPGGSINIGLTINNSGESYNEIYKNTFYSLYIGTLAQNINRSKNDIDGLKLNCNMYNQNEYDIAVTGSQGCGECGISKLQGSSDNPAGNWFSWQGDYPTSDFDNQMAHVDYYHHRGILGQDNRWIPIYYSSNTITRLGTQIEWGEDACSSRLGSIRNKELNNSLYSSSTAVSDSLENMLLQLIDGGNTDDLEMEITFAESDEALELRDELLGDSPYLSDTILIKSVEKEDVLAPVMVKEIMVANPQSAKSEKVLEALENRENPIPDYMMSEILQGKDTVANKEILEADLSWSDLQREIALNRLISIYRNDTSGVQSDSIVTLLQNHNTLPATYRLMMTYIEIGDTLSALNTLANIPLQFDLTTSQALIHQHWNEMLEVMLEMKGDSLMIQDMGSAQIVNINNLALFEDLPGCLARNMLHYLGIVETGPYYLLPEDQLKNAIFKPTPNKDSASIDQPFFKIYPNPAKNHIIVEYNIEDLSDDGLLTIYVQDGKLQLMQSLDHSKHHFIINTKDWSGGLYFFNFITQDHLNQTGKIIIAK